MSEPRENPSDPIEPVDVDPLTDEVLEFDAHPEFDEAAEAEFLSGQEQRAKGEAGDVNEGDADGATEDEDGEEPPPPTAEELEAECRELLGTTDILSVVDAMLQGSGFAGPTWPVQLLTLALYSRHLDKPVSIVVRGESASGKSYAIKRALEFASTDAHHAFTAMSDKALYYDKTDYSHLMLVAYEGESMKNDSVALAMRTLLSEGVLVYQVTDFESKSVIELKKEGPTGLITSTAGRIDYELGTRVISIPIDDSPDATKAIMLAEAARVEGKLESVNTEQFAALDRWMALNRSPVIVPFARKLSKLTDGRAVRMRRDFPSVLGLIQAHALMHQKHREKDTEGRILANVEDYAVVHGMVSDLVAYATGEAIPPEIRETVDAVRKLTDVPGTGGRGRTTTVVEVVKELGVHRTTVGRRLKRATLMGFVEAFDNSRGRSTEYDWVPGMSEDKAVLPHPDELR